MIDELFECDAISLTEQIKTGIVEASDMLSASIARAERLNTSLHAIVNFNTSQAKKLKFTDDQTVSDMNYAGNFFSEDVIQKVFEQIFQKLTDASQAKTMHRKIQLTNFILFDDGRLKL